MKTAARELAGKRIRVLNIAPGAIVAPINKFVLDDPEAKHAVEGEIPLRRMGNPDEIAAAVAWLASDQASRTLDDVGRTFNVTRERIRQLENQSLKKLRAHADMDHVRGVA